MATAIKHGGLEIESAPVGSNRLLDVQEVADLLRVPVSWVYQHTRRRAANRLPGFKLGGGKYLRFREADILAWIERQRAGLRPNA